MWPPCEWEAARVEAGTPLPYMELLGTKNTKRREKLARLGFGPERDMTQECLARGEYGFLGIGERLSIRLFEDDGIIPADLPEFTESETEGSFFLKRSQLQPSPLACATSTRTDRPPARIVSPSLCGVRNPGPVIHPPAAVPPEFLAGLWILDYVRIRVHQLLLMLLAEPFVLLRALEQTRLERHPALDDLVSVILGQRVPAGDILAQRQHQAARRCVGDVIVRARRMIDAVPAAARRPPRRFQSRGLAQGPPLFFLTKLFLPPTSPRGVRA